MNDVVVALADQLREVPRSRLIRLRNGRHVGQLGHYPELDSLLLISQSHRTISGADDFGQDRSRSGQPREQLELKPWRSLPIQTMNDRQHRDSAVVAGNRDDCRPRLEDFLLGIEVETEVRINPPAVNSPE